MISKDMDGQPISERDLVQINVNPRNEPYCGCFVIVDHANRFKVYGVIQIPLTDGGHHQVAWEGDPGDVLRIGVAEWMKRGPNEPDHTPLAPWAEDAIAKKFPQDDES